MKSAVTIAPREIAFVDGDPPGIGPNEARVAIEAVGLCGSDLHMWTGDNPYISYPRVQGHEASGTVIEVGREVATSLQGQRVAIEPLRSCGTCLPCRRSRYNACTNLLVFGAHLDGALREQVVLPARQLHQTGSLDAPLAALVEPMAIGMQAVHRAGLEAGDQCVIFGAGPIGLAILIAARDRGASALVVDPILERCVRASASGAEGTSLGGSDLGEELRAWTNGDGPVAIFEATGDPGVIRRAATLVADSGTVIVVGLSSAEVSLPVLDFTRKELTIAGSRNSANLFPDAVRLVERNQDLLRTLITQRFEFRATGAALDFALENPALTVKVIVDVGGMR